MRLKPTYDFKESCQTFNTASYNIRVAYNIIDRLFAGKYEPLSVPDFLKLRRWLETSQMDREMSLQYIEAVLDENDRRTS